MIILFLIGILGVNTVILFLLQPSKKMFTKDSPEMPFRTVVFGICLGVIVLFIIICLLLFSPVEDDAGETMGFFFPIFLVISVPISGILNMGLKVLYDAVFLPRFRKMEGRTHLRTTILWIKTSIVIGFFFFVGIQYTVNEHQRTAWEFEKGREYLEQLLGKPLPPSVTHISYRRISQYTHNTRWLKFTCADEKVIEKIRIRNGLVSGGKGCDVYASGYEIPDWWWEYGTDAHMESYIEEGEDDRETDVIFCYDAQNHIAYYHTIWRDFGAGAI